MTQFVTTSYRDARDADNTVEQLLDQGYSLSDTSIIVTDRTRRSYLADASTSPIGVIVTGPSCISKTMSLDVTGEAGTPVSVGGPLSREIERGVRDSQDLIELIASLGASSRDAEDAARDVARGGVFIAMAVRDQDVARMRQLMTERGRAATAAPRR